MANTQDSASAAPRGSCPEANAAAGAGPRRPRPQLSAASASLPLTQRALERLGVDGPMESLQLSYKLPESINDGFMMFHGLVWLVPYELQ